MRKFKVGDKVKHKSGSGPIMAVKGYNDLGEVICKWYERGKKEWKEEIFAEEELESYKEGPGVRVRGYETF